MRRPLARCVLLLPLLGLTGCATTVTHTVRPAPVTAFAVREAGFTPEQLEQIEDNCPLGMPAKDPEFAFPPTAFVVREGYVLEHSSVDKVALWVCEHLTPTEVADDPNVKRRNRFAPDPQLQSGERSELDDYRGSGFDRGHQAPAGNQNSSQRLKDETFSLSNMAPQVGSGFNQNVWADLEHLTRDWVRDGVVADEYILTGGFFYDPAEEDPQTADGLIEYSTVGPGAVAVPTHFYKIVAANDGDTWKAVGFVLENRSQSTPSDFSIFIKPIDWIEERTGLDFLPDLDPISEQTVESQAGTLWQ